MTVPADSIPIEQVLVVNAELLKSLDVGQGLTFGVEKEMGLLEESAFFLERAQAERDTGYKQLIPYCILRYGSQVFTYMRGKRSGESRLRGERSIGIGGHVSTLEPTLLSNNPLRDGMKREIDEEVDIGSDYEVRTVALLNDDSNEVGEVHLGIVSVVSLEKPDVTRSESGITQCEFMKPSSLQKRMDEFESWSRICIENLDRLRWG